MSDERSRQWTSFVFCFSLIPHPSSLLPPFPSSMNSPRPASGPRIGEALRLIDGDVISASPSLFLQCPHACRFQDTPRTATGSLDSCSISAGSTYDWLSCSAFPHRNVLTSEAGLLAASCAMTAFWRVVNSQTSLRPPVSPKHPNPTACRPGFRPRRFPGRCEYATRCPDTTTIGASAGREVIPSQNARWTSAVAR